MEEKNAVKNWLQRIENCDLKDIPSLLDDAPEAIQELRGAWENSEMSLLVQGATAVSFLEGFLAAHPALSVEA